MHRSFKVEKKAKLQIYRKKITLVTHSIDHRLLIYIRIMSGPRTYHSKKSLALMSVTKKKKLLSFLVSLFFSPLRLCRLGGKRDLLLNYQSIIYFSPRPPLNSSLPSLSPFPPSLHLSLLSCQPPHAVQENYVYFCSQSCHPHFPKETKNKIKRQDVERTNNSEGEDGGGVGL